MKFAILMYPDESPSADIKPPISEGSGFYYGFMLKLARPPPIHQCLPLPQRVCCVTTQEQWDGLFPNFVHTLVVIVPWPDYILKVISTRWRSQGHKIMWLFHIFISDYIFFLYQVLYKNIPWPFICPSVCLSFCSFITFSGFHTFAVKRHKNIPWPFICPSTQLSIPFCSFATFSGSCTFAVM